MRRRARALERRELSLELGDARGQRVAFGLERPDAGDATQSGKQV